MATKASIDRFLDRRRLAVVGVSRDPRDFTRGVYRAFVERGYDAWPVNAAGGVGHRLHRFFVRLAGRLPR
jgi:predicted CoA-binding protein